MNQEFSNAYDDKVRAEAYDSLEFPGTYYLAYRDLPAMIRKYVTGKRAIDFGCGAGRSTRFLRSLGFEVVGVDISENMLTLARRRDPDGDYRLIPNDDLSEFAAGSFDLVQAVLTFDNIPTLEKKLQIFQSLKRLLNNNGRIVIVVCSPETYVHEWASFSTKDFPGNRTARSGENVFVVMLDVDDRRPVEDILCSADDYLEMFRRAGLVPADTHKPLGNSSEPYRWVSETTVAPWTIYVLKPKG